ncbi:DUF3558 domain-containing protein [Saccharopolyspora indica]|uniref:DUF3558 domain-containing protein n=1 Tax=Saccharopolyspora indica TaxID=1229659 RepID=UPI0022EB91AA|nr:DUF3558 domain-containing protein [Saccharopolyspora indica]MDA3650182.1 DUF3558 domain-containing protein [Saccharopolyspora indica]
MREGLAAGVIVAGLLLAGCSSGATPADQPGAPGRSAPQKTLPTSDPCAVLTEEQLKTLVLDQEPKQAEQNGLQGCEFRSGGGWSVFVAADAAGTYQQFVEANQGAQELPLAGYPSAIVNDETGCHLTMDVADAGSLKLTALVGPGAPLEVGGSCDAAAKVAESVLQNLPSA